MSQQFPLPREFWERVVVLYEHLGWRETEHHRRAPVTSADVDALAVVGGDTCKLPKYASMSAQPALHRWIFCGVEMTNTTIFFTPKTVMMVTSSKKKAYFGSVTAFADQKPAKQGSSSSTSSASSASSASAFKHHGTLPSLQFFGRADPGVFDAALKAIRDAAASTVRLGILKGDPAGVMATEWATALDVASASELLTAWCIPIDVSVAVSQAMSVKDKDTMKRVQKAANIAADLMSKLRKLLVDNYELGQ